jgi:prepilin-type N-terminal cleavage/methylation domain-containing protein
MESAARVSKRKSGGFTLIEVLLSMMVLTFSALIFTAAFPTSQISRMKAVHMTYAIGVAQQTLEEKRSAGYSAVIPGEPTVSIPAELPGAQQTTTISQYDSNTRQVEVTITWGGYRKAGGNITLATLISDHS